MTATGEPEARGPGRAGPVPAPARRLGCLGYGLIALVVAAIVLYFAVPPLITAVLRSIEERYTEAEPRAIPIATMPAAERDALFSRVRAFSAQVDRGDAAAELALSGAECNALISDHEDLAELRGRVHVALTGDRVRLEFSFQVNSAHSGAAEAAPRYWNGEAEMEFEVKDGVMDSVIHELRLGGESLVDAETGNTDRQRAQVPFLATEHEGVKSLEHERRIERFEVLDGVLHVRVGPKK
ncbi:MAG: hypothetical protein NXI31_27035 [bacterium]|nr:hypothetical protein [bacterium]